MPRTLVYLLFILLFLPPGDPANNLKEAWNIARGFETNGNIVIDPATNKSTKFPLSGDPVTNEGWVYTGTTGGGAGFNLFTGPFDLAPNDTQWVMMALIPALGNDINQSISTMRDKANNLRSLPYDTLAFGVGTKKKIEEEPKIIPAEFKLFQNYPNPFNSSTIIKYSIPGLNGADSETPINIELKLYDVLGREIKTLINITQPPGNYQIVFNAGSLASGVYIYTIKAGDFYESKKLVLLK